MILKFIIYTELATILYIILKYLNKILYVDIKYKLQITNGHNVIIIY